VRIERAVSSYIQLCVIINFTVFKLFCRRHNVEWNSFVIQDFPETIYTIYHHYQITSLYELSHEKLILLIVLIINTKIIISCSCRNNLEINGTYRLDILGGVGKSNLDG